MHSYNAKELIEKLGYQDRLHKFVAIFSIDVYNASPLIHLTFL